MSKKAVNVVPDVPGQTSLFDGVGTAMAKNQIETGKGNKPMTVADRLKLAKKALPAALRSAFAATEKFKLNDEGSYVGQLEDFVLETKTSTPYTDKEGHKHPAVKYDVFTIKIRLSDAPTPEKVGTVFDVRCSFMPYENADGATVMWGALPLKELLELNNVDTSEMDHLDAALAVTDLKDYTVGFTVTHVDRKGVKRENITFDVLTNETEEQTA